MPCNTHLRTWQQLTAATQPVHAVGPEQGLDSARQFLHHPILAGDAGDTLFAKAALSPGDELVGRIPALIRGFGVSK